MSCIHGFDVVNCPVCRMSISQIPINSITKIEKRQNDLLPKNPLFEKNRIENTKYRLDLIPNNLINPPMLIKNLPTIDRLGEIPTFTNVLFKNRLEVEKTSPIKKVSINNPELDLEDNK